MGKKPASAPPPGQQPGKGAKRPAAADAADIDDLFAQLPKRNARAAVSGGDSAAAGAAGRVRGPGSGFTADGVPPGRPVSRPRGGEAPVRRDKPVVKGRPHYLDNGEKLVPVSAPRRFEDGLPVYKSFDDFSDLQADQGKQQAGPLKGGKCPFDCWCCV